MITTSAGTPTPDLYMLRRELYVRLGVTPDVVFPNLLSGPSRSGSPRAQRRDPLSWLRLTLALGAPPANLLS